LSSSSTSHSTSSTSHTTSGPPALFVQDEIKVRKRPLLKTKVKLLCAQTLHHETLEIIGPSIKVIELKQFAQDLWFEDYPLKEIIILDQTDHKAPTPKALELTGQPITFLVVILTHFNATQISYLVEEGKIEKPADIKERTFEFEKIKQPIVIYDTNCFGTSGVLQSDLKLKDNKYDKYLFCITTTIKREAIKLAAVSEATFLDLNPDITVLDAEEFSYQRRRVLFELLYPFVYKGKTYKRDTSLTWPNEFEEWDGTEKQPLVDSSRNDIGIWVEAIILSRRYQQPVTVYTHDTDFRRFDAQHNKIRRILLNMLPEDGVDNVSIRVV